MSGHVFHPGHEELHGVTVVIEGASGRTYVGRYHERGSRGVVLHDVGVHEPGSELSRDEWIARLLKFGVKVDHRTLVIPDDEAGGMRRLAS
ncbi:MAG TPA: hypothetical protein VF037_03285 [Gemmatimonadales bacterium]